MDEINRLIIALKTRRIFDRKKYRIEYNVGNPKNSIPATKH